MTFLSRCWLEGRLSLALNYVRSQAEHLQRLHSSVKEVDSHYSSDLDVVTLLDDYSSFCDLLDLHEKLVSVHKFDFAYQLD